MTKWIEQKLEKLPNGRYKIIPCYGDKAGAVINDCDSKLKAIKIVNEMTLSLSTSNKINGWLKMPETLSFKNDIYSLKRMPKGYIIIDDMIVHLNSINAIFNEKILVEAFSHDITTLSGNQIEEAERWISSNRSPMPRAEGAAEKCAEFLQAVRTGREPILACFYEGKKYPYKHFATPKKQILLSNRLERFLSPRYSEHVDAFRYSTTMLPQEPLTDGGANIAYSLEPGDDLNGLQTFIAEADHLHEIRGRHDVQQSLADNGSWPD